MREESAGTEALIRWRIEDSITVKRHLISQSPLLTEVAGRLIEAYANGKKLVLFGNGGSAADAQHIAAEFTGRYYLDRDALPAEALSANISAITAIGNDYGFDQIFARQLQGLGASGDVAIGLSTSGDSVNVVEAMRVAGRMGMITIGLTGESGGELKRHVDYCICVPSRDTPRIQEAHLLVCHIWAELVEQALFGSGSGA